jgi:alkyldihydroxyacetonephosphate synthase
MPILLTEGEPEMRDLRSRSSSSMITRRKFWGWGLEEEGLTAGEVRELGEHMATRFGLRDIEIRQPPRLEDLDLPPARLAPPESLRQLLSDDLYDRAAHTYGKSFRDLVRAFRREYPHPPDLVAFPRDEADVTDILEWCEEQTAAAIPYGGGSSVVGGVEPDVGDAYKAAISIDLGCLDEIMEIDRESRAARIQAGVMGPALEEHLKPHGLTLRHYPQSFEYSSLGGWIATRSGGHFASLFTHIDEFVEALRVVTPRGVIETRRLPGSGAGPAPERLFCGSEGTLGVIVDAWMRLQDRPTFRAGASVLFGDFESAVVATRAIALSGLYPSNCRLLDHNEALISGTGDGANAILIVAFESADHPLEPWMARVLEICREHNGRVPEEATQTRTDASTSRAGAAGAWRNAFLRGGHIRDAMVMLGMVHETFETAITWDRFFDFHAAVMEQTTAALREACGGGVVSSRFAYVYPDGPAPYYSVIAPGRPGAELEQWELIKSAASEVINKYGATITHHHAVGRDHRPWYDLERPEPFAEALRAAKAALDPAAIMNPGVLLDPRQERVEI